MKKLLVIILTLVLTLIVFTGCDEEGDSSDLNIYSEASFDNESKFVPDEESKGSEVSEEALTGEFVVKDKKYTFEGNDLVIVSVENQTNKNYSVTVTGTYLDKDGNVLKTETQTFDQYSAGYSGYFLFKPDMQFDKFTYEFKSEETEGPFYAKDLTFKFNGFEEQWVTITEQELKNDFTKYPTIVAPLSIAYSGNVKVHVVTYWVLLTETGEVIEIIFYEPWLNPGVELSDRQDFPLYQTMEDDFVWPEGWKNNVQAIPILKKIGLEY